MKLSNPSDIIETSESFLFRLSEECENVDVFWFVYETITWNGMKLEDEGIISHEEKIKIASVTMKNSFLRWLVTDSSSS